MGAVKAEATSNALSEKIDHDAEIALIEEATARAVAAETPSYPEGKISVPIYPNKRPLKRKHDSTLYADVDYGM